jgi:2'-5' RNA ligase
MSVIRTFIALDISQPIRDRLGELAAGLQSHLPPGVVRWVSPPNIHLTLIFLGEISQTNLAHLTRELQAECAHYSPMALSVGELGAFPSSNRPRVIWVGIQAPPALLSLQSGLQQRLERLGYQNEDREFAPHLTLGRVNKTASPANTHAVSLALHAEKVGFLGTFQADAVNLMRSDLHPGGPVYTMMERALFAGSIK